jgi:hypothetical protein
MSNQMDKPPAENLESLEAHLAGTLQPVAPPKDFVRRLRSSIHMPMREVIVSRLRDWNRLFLVFGSVMSGILILITIARALYYMVGRRDMA